jgi:hypothetical protein
MEPSLLEEALESLDLSRAEPGVGLLQALFSRFNARVPFETASKIERDAAVSDAATKPRLPATFWRDHVDRGAGGTCFARVAAFETLLRGLGFQTRKIVGRVTRDFDHAALIVEASGRSWLCDVGFPLPALLPAAPGELETLLGRVSIEPTPRGFDVDLGGVPEGPRRLELFLEPVSEDRFRQLWRQTFRPDSRFLTAVSLRIQLENRAVSFAAGQLRVDDLHSRLTVPLPAPRAGRLSDIFGLEESLVSAAFARVGDPEPPGPDALLTAYLEFEGDPARAFDAIASASGYRRLLEGVAAVAEEETRADGWLLRLTPPGPVPAGGPAALEEHVSPEPSIRRLRVIRSSGSSSLESFFQAEERGGKTYLMRQVRLSGPREDLLRNDSLRGRLAAGLAVDLLAWARLL